MIYIGQFLPEGIRIDIPLWMWSWSCSLYMLDDVENGSWNDIAIPFPYLSWCEVQLWMWYTNLYSADLQTKIPEALNHPLNNYHNSSQCVLPDHLRNVLNTSWKHIKSPIGKYWLVDQNCFEVQYQQYCPITMNKGVLDDGISPPACWNQPKPPSFDFWSCTWMAIDKLVNYLSTHCQLSWCTTWTCFWCRHYKLWDACADLLT